MAIETTARRTEPRWAELESIVTTPHCRPGTDTDDIDGVTPSFVACPDSPEQISEILKWAVSEDVAVSVRGGGTKTTWANTPQRADLVLSTERISGVVEHAWEDLAFTVKAGTAISALQTHLATHRQRLALDPLWPDRSTVGGVIATNDSGSLRLRFGSVRDLILGVTIVLPNGTIARSGGKVVKNVAGYDLPKLLVGSYGTLAVITEATFRAHPFPQSVRTLSFEFNDIDAANRFMLAIADTAMVPTGMQLRSERDRKRSVDVRFEGVPVGIEVQSRQAITLAGDARNVVPAPNCWNIAESFWNGAQQCVIGKFSVLPSRIASTVQLLSRHFTRLRIVVQSTGLGLFRAEFDSIEQLSCEIQELHAAFQTGGGTLTLLQLPHDLKKRTDVFGPGRDSQALMVRVKQQFDPNGILNPGRFVGGI